MTLQCSQARRLLWPDARPREATAGVLEAQAHLAGCLACRQFFDEMRTVGALIHRAAPREAAPAEIRERLFRVIARARMGPPARRPWPRWSLAAAAAGLVLAAGLWRGSSRAPEADPIAAFADDHLRAAAGPGVQTAEASAAASWLRERLPFAIQVPRFPDGRVAGARLCVMAGMHGGVVEYRLQDHDLSYYVVLAGASLSDSTALQLRSVARAGYRVIAWREGELLHALVADLPEATLRELARICIEQSVRAAAGRASMEFALAPVGMP